MATTEWSWRSPTRTQELGFEAQVAMDTGAQFGPYGKHDDNKWMKQVEFVLERRKANLIRINVNDEIYLEVIKPVKKREKLRVWTNIHQEQENESSTEIVKEVVEAMERVKLTCPYDSETAEENTLNSERTCDLICTSENQTFNDNTDAQNIENTDNSDSSQENQICHLESNLLKTKLKRGRKKKILNVNFQQPSGPLCEIRSTKSDSNVQDLGLLSNILLLRKKRRKRKTIENQKDYSLRSRVNVNCHLGSYMSNVDAMQLNATDSQLIDDVSSSAARETTPSNDELDCESEGNSDRIFENQTDTSVTIYIQSDRELCLSNLSSTNLNNDEHLREDYNTKPTAKKRGRKKKLTNGLSCHVKSPILKTKLKRGRKKKIQPLNGIGQKENDRNVEDSDVLSSGLQKVQRKNKIVHKVNALSTGPQYLTSAPKKRGRRKKEMNSLNIEKTQEESDEKKSVSKEDSFEELDNLPLIKRIRKDTIVLKHGIRGRRKIEAEKDNSSSSQEKQICHMQSKTLKIRLMTRLKRIFRKKKILNVPNSQVWASSFSFQKWQRSKQRRKKNIKIVKNYSLRTRGEEKCDLIDNILATKSKRGRKKKILNGNSQPLNGMENSFSSGCLEFHSGPSSDLDYQGKQCEKQNIEVDIHSDLTSNGGEEMESLSENLQQQDQPLCQIESVFSIDDKEFNSEHEMQSSFAVERVADKLPLESRIKLSFRRLSDESWIVNCNDNLKEQLQLDKLKEMVIEDNDESTSFSAAEDVLNSVLDKISDGGIDEEILDFDVQTVMDDLLEAVAKEEDYNLAEDVNSIINDLCIVHDASDNKSNYQEIKQQFRGNISENVKVRQRKVKMNCSRKPSSVKKQSVVKTKNKSFMCTVCGRRFKYEESLKYHQC